MTVSRLSGGACQSLSTCHTVSLSVNFKWTRTVSLNCEPKLQNRNGNTKDFWSDRFDTSGSCKCYSKNNSNLSNSAEAYTQMLQSIKRARPVRIMRYKRSKGSKKNDLNERSKYDTSTGIQCADSERGLHYISGRTEFNNSKMLRQVHRVQQILCWGSRSVQARFVCFFAAACGFSGVPLWALDCGLHTSLKKFLNFIERTITEPNQIRILWFRKRRSSMIVATEHRWKQGKVLVIGV